MMRKVFCVFCILSVVATAAQARVRCRQDGMGGSKCVGYNSNGEYVSLRSRTNGTGLTTTQGRIGNRSVNTRARIGASRKIKNIPGHPENQRVYHTVPRNAMVRTVTTTGATGVQPANYIYRK